jgi:hypothetical protein
MLFLADRNNLSTKEKKILSIKPERITAALAKISQPKR